MLHCLPFIDDVTYAVYSQEMTQISTCAYRQILWHICLMHVLYMSTIKSNKYSLNQKGEKGKMKKKKKKKNKKKKNPKTTKQKKKKKKKKQQTNKKQKAK